MRDKKMCQNIRCSKYLMEVKQVDNKNRQLINDFIVKRWFGLNMILRGDIIDMGNMDGFYCEEKSNIVGLLTYRINYPDLEITSLGSIRENHGIGSFLIEYTKTLSKRKNLNSVVVITTNDNLRALEFYQKRVFILNKIYFNSIREARKLKPAIPLKNDNGILIRDEIELKFFVSSDI